MIFHIIMISEKRNVVLIIQVKAMEFVMDLVIVNADLHLLLMIVQ